MFHVTNQYSIVYCALDNLLDVSSNPNQFAFQFIPTDGLSFHRKLCGTLKATDDDRHF